MSAPQGFESAIDWRAAAASVGAVTGDDVARALAKDRLSPADLPALLAPAADAALEAMARRARALTLQRFGRAVVLYAPLYISSFCINACRYCGFRRDNAIPRRTLSIAEIEREMAHLKAQGFDHILLVSGENPRELSLEYLAAAVGRAHERFSSVAIEILPLEGAGYRRLVEAGCDGLALYQETYDPDEYARVHPAGPKRDFAARLRAVEEAAAAGMRSLGIGALLGLADWRIEGVMLGRHAAHLMRRHWRARIAFSFPRIRPAAGGFTPPRPVGDRDMVHLMCALRLAFPDAEIVISTRESSAFRDGAMRLGVATRFSAGSSTEPGGYTLARDGDAQFAVDDARSPAEVAAAIAENGYDPVWKDWDRAFAGQSATALSRPSSPP